MVASRRMSGTPGWKYILYRTRPFILRGGAVAAQGSFPSKGVRDDHFCRCVLEQVQLVCRAVNEEDGSCRYRKPCWAPASGHSWRADGGGRHGGHQDRFGDYSRANGPSDDTAVWLLI